MSEWIVGRNPVYEVLRAGRREVHRLLFAQGVQEKGRLRDIRRLARLRNAEVEQAPRGQVERLGEGTQGVALQTEPYPYSSLPEILERAALQGEPPFLLLLDALQDPQNLGSLLRTAEIVGVHGVLLPYRRTATVTPAVVSASSGASEHLLIAQANLAQGIDLLKEQGIWVAGLEGDPSSENEPQAYYPDQTRLDGPLAIVVGNEGQGMRKLVRNTCDFLLRLPMRGEIDSLNAAVAGSVALYLAWQARGYAGRRAAKSA